MVAVRRLLLTQPYPVFGGGIFSRALNAKNGAAVGHKSSDLASLDTADLQMIGGHDANGSRGRFSQLRNVIGVAIQDGPADFRRSRGASHLRQSRAANR